MLSFATTAWLLAIGPGPFCTTVPPMLYSEIVGDAQQIVSGTATSHECKLANGGKTIRTYVTFDRLTWHKGAAAPTLMLQLEGGKVGDARLQVPDMPEFKIGSRYLLYVAYNGTNLSPIVGFHQGAFEIINRDGRDVLVNSRGLELIGVTNDRLVFAGKPLPKPAANLAPAAVPVAGFVPQPAGPDAAEKQAAELARIEAHDRAQRTEPLPELPVSGAPSAPANARNLPPVKASPGAPIPLNTKPVDKSPIVVPFDQDRGTRTSIQSLLDTVPFEGRR